MASKYLHIKTVKHTFYEELQHAIAIFANRERLHVPYKLLVAIERVCIYNIGPIGWNTATKLSLMYSCTQLNAITDGSQRLLSQG